jgi:hypothetical protein
MAGEAVRLVGLGRLLGLGESDVWIPEGGGGREAGIGGWMMRMVRRDPDSWAGWALEEVDVDLADGRRVELLLKYVDPEALRGGAAKVLPSRVFDPDREVATYRRILAPRRLGPALYGSAADSVAGRFRILAERVPGPRLQRTGDIRTWEAAARWLARFHVQLAGEEAETLARECGLVPYHRGFYEYWMERALRRPVPTSGGEPGGAPAGDPLPRVARHHPRIVEHLLELPRTVVHGWFGPCVVHAAPGSERGQVRVVPTGWGAAGLGPPLVDLAGLLSDRWSEEENRRLALVYRREWIRLGGDGWRDERAFFKALDRCRLHRIVQWLGSADEKGAPPDRRLDRALEAVRLATRLDSSHPSGSARSPSNRSVPRR